MAWGRGDGKFKKASGEGDFLEGQPVWLIRYSFVSKFGKGNKFGTVLENSTFPNLWVNISIEDANMLVEYDKRWEKKYARHQVSSGDKQNNGSPKTSNRRRTSRSV